MQKMHDRKNVGKLILDPSIEPKPKAQVSFLCCFASLSVQHISTLSALIFIAEPKPKA